MLVTSQVDATSQCECRSNASATSATPLRTKGAITGGALDYEYRKPNLLHPWVLFDDFFMPIFILAFGFWASIETLKLAFVSSWLTFIDLLRLAKLE